MSCCRRKNPKPCSNCRRNAGAYGVQPGMDPLIAYQQGIITDDRYHELTGEWPEGTFQAATGGVTKKSWFWPAAAAAAIGGIAMMSKDKK